MEENKNKISDPCFFPNIGFLGRSASGWYTTIYPAVQLVLLFLHSHAVGDLMRTLPCSFQYYMHMFNYLLFSTSLLIYSSKFTWFTLWHELQESFLQELQEKESTTQQKFLSFCGGYGHPLGACRHPKHRAELNGLILHLHISLS
jgi:hypothetical protein